MGDWKSRRFINCNVFSDFLIIGGGTVFCRINFGDDEFERDDGVKSIMNVEWAIGNEDFDAKYSSNDFDVDIVDVRFDLGKLSTRSGSSMSCCILDEARKYCAWHSSTVWIPDKISRNAKSISMICWSSSDGGADELDVKTLWIECVGVIETVSSCCSLSILNETLDNWWSTLEVVEIEAFNWSFASIGKLTKDDGLDVIRIWEWCGTGAESRRLNINKVHNSKVTFF